MAQPAPDPVPDPDDGSLMFQPRPDPDMTILHSVGEYGASVNLLDRYARDKLLHELESGRIVEVCDGATGMTLAYALCTNADLVRRLVDAGVAADIGGDCRLHD